MCVRASLVEHMMFLLFSRTDHCRSTAKKTQKLHVWCESARVQAEFVRKLKHSITELKAANILALQGAMAESTPIVFDREEVSECVVCVGGGVCVLCVL